MAEELKYTPSRGPVDSKGDEPWEQLAGGVDPKAHEYYGDDDHEGSDRGLFGFQRKYDEEEHEKTYGESEACELTPEEKKLIRIDSSSSSEEEVDEGGEIIKKRKKKSLKENLEEKFSRETKEEEERKSYDHLPESTAGPVPVLTKYNHDTATAYDHHVGEWEEKKGLMDKIKEKLPCGKMPEADEEEGPVVMGTAPECEKEEKKSFLGKIKEKLQHKEDHAEEKSK